ncbi:MAG: glycosyltransferase family 39 protein [Thermoplasmata archaeon]|nr:MAG: glycosyltransferase family 39 protein [Thermoplasmata archaeon]
MVIIAISLRIIFNTPFFSNYHQDEAEYSLRSIYINEHNGAYNPDKWYDHPPFFMYAQAGVFLTFGDDWFIGRGFGIVLGLVTMFIFYCVGREWKNERLGLLMAGVFAFGPISVMLNRSAMIENLLGIFLGLIILFTIRYEKSNDNKYIYATAILIALALNTKHTAIILFPPFLYYFYKKDLFKRKEGWICIALIILIVLPIIVLMIDHGFIQLHLGKTSHITHESWGGMHPLLLTFALHFESLGTLLLRTGIALIPLYFGIKLFFKKPTIFTNMIMIWVVASILFFLTMRVTGYHYDYNEFLPMVPVIAMGLYFHRKWVIPVFIGLMVVTVCLISYAPDQQTEALVFLEKRLGDNDTVIALPYPEVAYHLKDKDVTVYTSDDIEEINASWVVASRRRITRLTENNVEINEYLEYYTLVFESEFDYYIGYLIYQRN